MAVAWLLILLVAVIYVPVLQKLFGVFQFTLRDWVLATIGAFTVVPVLECAKWMERRGWFGELQ
jgi:uncharacterized membrane protein